MARLTDSRITKGLAAGYLIRLYLSEPDFVAELEELRAGYLDPLTELMVKEVGFLVGCRAAMGADEYQSTIRDLYTSYAAVPSISGLPVSLLNQLEDLRQLHLELRPYFRGLEQLASKWKLTAPWAGPMLHLHHVHDCLKGIVTSDDIDVPLEQLDLLYPWPPPLPPLEIKVPASAFFLYGRKHIQIEIARRLEIYESELRATGLRHRPSAIEDHAQWWFERRVKGKPYQEIVERFPDVYEDTIKRKVWEFSRLLGIETR